MWTNDANTETIDGAVPSEFERGHLVYWETKSWTWIPEKNKKYVKQTEADTIAFRNWNIGKRTAASDRKERVKKLNPRTQVLSPRYKILELQTKRLHKSYAILWFKNVISLRPFLVITIRQFLSRKNQRTVAPGVYTNSKVNFYQSYAILYL